MVRDSRPKLDRSEIRTVREAMRAELIVLAKLRQTITYSELGRLIGVHHRSPLFISLLGEVCEDEEEAGRGMICALVVAKATGIPGGGFFAGASARGRDITDIERCWHDECERVFAAWAKTTDNAAL